MTEEKVNVCVGYDWLQDSHRPIHNLVWEVLSLADMNSDSFRTK